MNTKNQHSLNSMVEQITNNTTGWIGHHPRENNEIARGQTFVASKEADVNAIEVYSNIVSKPGNIMMTIHSFDPQKNSWGPSLGSANVDIKKSDSEKWIAFYIPSLHLDKGKSYGFRLESHDSYIGVGEAAGSAKHPPFIAGQEWQFINNNQTGDAFTYFSLAFKVGTKA
jgi:hypothetical protein